MAKKKSDTATDASATAVAFSINWQKYVGGFAEAVGKSIEDVNECLLGIVGEPSDEALTILASAEAVPNEDLKKAFEKLAIPSGKLNLHLAKLRGEPVVVETTAPVGQSPIQALSILPAVPDDSSFLDMLKTGGVLKIEATEVLSAVKAALAKQVGLFDLPGVILKKMEEYADKQEKPCGPEYYEMEKLLTQKKYGDLFSAMGVSGNLVSESRKNKLFARLHENLWIALRSFQNQLQAWQDNWMSSMGNPAMLMMAMTNNQLGGAMPPNMIAPPDTTAIRDAGEEVINTLNRIFSGTGIPVARALAYDATRIMEIVNNPNLPMQVGVTDKDQMLKELGIKVGAEIIRTEQNLTRYTLSIMSLPKVTTDVENAYLAALIQLGTTIPWDKLDGRAGIGKSGIGKRLSDRDIDALKEM